MSNTVNEIKQITVNNITYNLKDDTARQDLAQRIPLTNQEIEEIVNATLEPAEGVSF